MLQKSKPNDYVISTGISKSVKNFVEEAFKIINIRIKWKGKGLNENDESFCIYNIFLYDQNY